MTSPYFIPIEPKINSCTPAYYPPFTYSITLTHSHFISRFASKTYGNFQQKQIKRDMIIFHKLLKRQSLDS